MIFQCYFLIYVYLVSQTIVLNYILFISNLNCEQPLQVKGFQMWIICHIKKTKTNKNRLMSIPS